MDVDYLPPWSCNHFWATMTTMPLTEDARVVLEAMERALPKVETMTGPEARRATKEAIPPLVDPEAVARVENRKLPGPAREIPVRIYWPMENEPLGAVVFFHGGGWVICDLDSHDGLCRSMANAVGCVAVSVDYRLAPEHKFPAAAEDCYAATKWVVENGPTLGVHSERIAVCGDSAGGNLAAAVTLMARDLGEPPLVFQAMVYPVTDHSFGTPSYRENGEGYFLTEAAMRWFWTQYLPEGEDGGQAYASPLRAADLGGLPPALIVTAEYDPLRDEGEAYRAPPSGGGSGCDMRPVRWHVPRILQHGPADRGCPRSQQGDFRHPSQRACKGGSRRSAS